MFRTVLVRIRLVTLKRQLKRLVPIGFQLVSNSFLRLSPAVYLRFPQASSGAAPFPCLVLNTGAASQLSIISRLSIIEPGTAKCATISVAELS